MAFWISLSGPTHLENFGYLLRENWRILGYSQEKIDMLYEQWIASTVLPIRGASYEEWLAATTEYRADAFVREMSGNPDKDAESYARHVEKLAGDPPTIDERTRLRIYVPDFPAMLTSIDVPVLALYGEKDTNVDWRASKELYEQTIGKRQHGRLTVVTFPDGDHNFNKSETGGISEAKESGPRESVEGLIPTMLDWIDELDVPEP